jgi:diadenosine tetraphosphate (Ap4A) HIT family hydrolase
MSKNSINFLLFFLFSWIHHNIEERKEMIQSTAAWMERERWEALLRGDNCPLCREYISGSDEHENGYPIAELKFSRLSLSKNQFPAGYCVLVCKKHVREPYNLTKEEQAFFFNDLMRAAKALESVFQPAKMNFSMLGNLVPHLHAHIQPRYYGDQFPGRPVVPGDVVVKLSHEEYQERIRLIRNALEKIKE